jgi:hypothetical protein
MISSALRQLTYMLERKSLNWVSRTTGITSRSLKQLQTTGTLQQPAYKRALTNAYHRESYARLRDVGFTVDQAKVYSRKIPEIASAWESNMLMKIADLTTGHVANRLQRYEGRITQSVIDKYFDIIYNEVLEGIKKSRVDPEDWLDYT